MSKYWRKDGYPEQEEIRQSLDRYLAEFPSYKDAARKIGTDTGTLRAWRRGAVSIPQWFCEFLGFRQVISYERVSISVTPTGKTA